MLEPESRRPDCHTQYSLPMPLQVTRDSINVSGPYYNSININLDFHILALIITPWEHTCCAATQLGGGWSLRGFLQEGSPAPTGHQGVAWRPGGTTRSVRGQLPEDPTERTASRTMRSHDKKEEVGTHLPKNAPTWRSAFQQEQPACPPSSRAFMLHPELKTFICIHNLDMCVH